MAVLVTCGTCQREFRAKDQARGVKLKCPGCGTALTVDGPRVANHEVFLSYSHKDKSVADAVCAALENRKIRCWMAPRDIAPGGDWSASIITAIEDARIMVLIFSSSSNMSQQVLREVERAVSKGLIVLPFRIESVDLSKSMEYFLSACDWMDALTSPFDEHLKALTTQVKLMLLGGEAGETKPLGADLSRNIQGKIRGPQPRKPLMTLAAAAVVCLFIAGGLFAWHLSRGVRFPNRESESSVLPTTAPVAQASIPPPAIAADTPVRETATTKPEETVAADSSKGSEVLPTTSDASSPPERALTDRAAAKPESLSDGVRRPADDSKASGVLPNLPDALGSAQAVTATKNSAAQASERISRAPNPLPAGRTEAANRPSSLQDLTAPNAITLTGHPDAIARIQFLTGDRLIAFGSSPTTHAVVWSLTDGSIMSQSAQPANSIVSSDGAWLFTPGSLVSVSTGQHVSIATVSPSDRAVFSADCSRVAVGSPWGAGEGSPVRVFECLTGKQLFATPEPNGKIAHFDLSADGRRLLAAGGTRAISTWNVDSGQTMPRCSWSGPTRMQALLSLDGNRVCAVSSQRSLYVVADVNNANRLFSGPTSNAPRKTLSAAGDGFIISWDAGNYSTGLIRIGHDGPKPSTIRCPAAVSCPPAFSSDGKRMLVATIDGCVRVFDTDSGQQIAQFRGNASTFSSLAFSLDSRFIAAGENDKVVRVWKLPD